MSITATSNSSPSATAAPPVILTVAFPYAPIGPKAVGGAEVICSQLEAAMAEQGFTSVVVAHADSKPAGQLYPTSVPPGTIDDDLRAEVESAHQANIDRALAEQPISLVHMHGLDFERYRIPQGVPVLVTLHLPPGWYPESIWSLPENYHLLCVSETQRQACPETARERISVIENGVALPDAGTLRPEGRYALMLARICPEKNLHAGFDAARLAGMPAMLGGEVFPYEAHQRYMEEVIRPRLTTSGLEHEHRNSHAATEPAARFLGPVSGEEKQRLLSRAACLLLPSLAPETSSLVAMEALAAGVPVVGMAVGAVPEIVEHGRTGFLVQSGENAVADLAEAMRRLPELDRQECRRTAEARFPLSRMVEAYCRLYLALGAEQPIDHRSSNPNEHSPEVPPAPADAQQPLLVEELRDLADLERLTPEWAALWSSDPAASPFQNPAWLLPWWRQFGPDGELHALALREEETRRLVGFLPVYTYLPPDAGQAQLLLAGAGTSDYLDGIWDPTRPDAAAIALEHALDQRCWSQCSLHQLRTSSRLLQAAQQRSLPLVSSEPCSTLSTAGKLPGKIRVNVNRYRRLAEAQGALQCRLAADEESALAAFETLVSLHGRRWQERGQEGVLHDARVLAHHREALPLLLQAGLLRLFHLTLNGETMGVLYGLADGPHAAERRLYLYLIGFDERFASLSPGSLLLHEAWLHAREEGIATVDLLRGGESYKHLWGAQPEPTSGIDFRREPA